ncbi:MAG: toprim domain-containing protein [Dysgonomonas mossii]|uniref:toprim domain-containing protein n=1 Tax=Dysgonomonas mossii TaxID=163665 RepID=UPI0026F358F5|nr:toprim domain-containing protein [Dysgonomonas mossii]MBS5906974.1 toprim domain-containing protein [Dysgonomonas mossii]
MNINDLNKLSVKDYLAKMNIHPVKDRGYYGMYHSPFRADDNASMKVDFQKNLWIDFGSNEGGTLIDLVMRIDKCSIQQAMQSLGQLCVCTNVGTYQRSNVLTDSFSFHGNTIEIQKVQSIANPALIDYLIERAINQDIAKIHCKEIHYAANNKTYFAIGFENDSKGYELRNKYFKGCTNKDVMTYRRTDVSTSACLVFEGFMDYLSFLTLKDIQSAKQNVVVLNSVANLSKAISFIQSHKEIYTYLDNDESGKKATQQIKNSSINSTVSDQSNHYANYKDLNEFLVSTKKTQSEKQEQQRKPSRGFKM